MYTPLPEDATFSPALPFLRLMDKSVPVRPDIIAFVLVRPDFLAVPEAVCVGLGGGAGATTLGASRSICGAGILGILGARHIVNSSVCWFPFVSWSVQ